MNAVVDARIGAVHLLDNRWDDLRETICLRRWRGRRELLSDITIREGETSSDLLILIPLGPHGLKRGRVGTVFAKWDEARD